MSWFTGKDKLEIDNLNTRISELEEDNEKLRSLEADLRRVVEEKNTEIKKVATSPHDKQLGIVTQAFDKLTGENTKLKLEVVELKETIGILNKAKEDLSKKITDLKHNKNSDSSKNKISYKVLIKNLFSDRKHDEFRKLCKVKNLIYVSQLDDLDFDELVSQGASKTKTLNAEHEYLRFKEGDFTSEIERYMVYGDSVSKVFFRYRSFVEYLTNSNIEYISELDTFDFSTLDHDKFTDLQISKLTEKLAEYNTLRKII